MNSPVDEKFPYHVEDRLSVDDKTSEDHSSSSSSLSSRRRLPLGWKLLMIVLTCLCTFGNHWSNGLIVALKTTIIKETHINNSEFATLVAITNLINTFLCIGFGYCIDKWGGAPLSVIFAGFHLAGSLVMAGASTNNLNSYALLIVGKVIAAIGDGSLDNAQHRIFSTYFAPGRGFAFSIGTIWGIANLAQFTGQSTANIVTTKLGSYSYALWIGAAIAMFSFICAAAVVFLDRYLRANYAVTDQTSGKRHTGQTRRAAFNFRAMRNLPLTFWIVVAFSAFENAGVQSFVSISTQFAQQRLQQGAVIGGWVSSFYLLLPACLTPFLGIYIDAFGQRIGFLFLSALTFLVSMILLRFSHTVPPFITAYVFYALSQARDVRLNQSVTPAPQVEIVRNIIPNPQDYATGFAIKKSVVQASIVIITTAAGKMQDDSPNNSLEPAVSLWLAYALISVVISGGLLFVSYFMPTLLPAARLSQVSPRVLSAEVECLCEKIGLVVPKDEVGEVSEVKEKEKRLKAPEPNKAWLRWTCLGAGAAIIIIGWILFGVGIAWGVHANVVAGTVGD
ncbi:uncharacterized protein FIBRA_08155 [Fibroporia radiculosa]|uniref:Lysosomal dipeptide transporter MFSD1 n=1 Tax=Fibroporia radiculosa TaxID=599839 RepID=J4I2A3_9APHY|nr:uncharacterized protein FIBRA_08155 [Fibroporia radiculosa]CCM05917.1 predicted protein [Fibroporia radiculosa]